MLADIGGLGIVILIAVVLAALAIVFLVSRPKARWIRSRSWTAWPRRRSWGSRSTRSGGGTRTHNLRINSPPLCRLSYPGSPARRATAPTESTNAPRSD